MIPTLSLSGTVGDEFGGFTSATVRDFLAQHRGQPIRVAINSGGGAAFEGVAIYNMLVGHDAEVTTENEAIAASAASLIYMAGSKRVMRHGSLLMIHDPSGITVGDADSHRQTADVLDSMSESYASIYAARSGLRETKVRELMTAETWMNPDEAIELGFATEKDEASPARAIAQFDYTIYARTPSIDGVAMSTALAPAAKPWAAKFLSIAGNAHMSAADASNILATADSLDAAKDALIDLVAARQAPGPDENGARGVVSLDNPEFRFQAMSDAIYMKAGRTGAVHPAAKTFAAMSLSEIAQDFVQMATGRRVPIRRSIDAAHDIRASFAGHSRSDFPQILGNAANRILAEAYSIDVGPLLSLSVSRPAADFRPLSNLRLGEAPQLERVQELGEYKHGTIGESGETYSVAKFGKMFGLSFEAQRNDDLSAFTRVIPQMGQQAALTATGELVALLNAGSGAGPNMSDGNPVFHSSRGNISTGAPSALALTSLSTARTAMRTVKGLDGVTSLNLAPRYLLVPPALETTAQQLTAEITPAQTSNVNPFTGLEPRVEARLASATGWYLFADPAAANVLQHSYLDDEDGPTITTNDVWENDMTVFKVRLVFGCGFTDFRGAHRAAGA